MTINFSAEGLAAIGKAVDEKLGACENKTPVITGVTEAASTALLGTTAVLAVKSGISRLARNEATYGGFGPVLTIALGVVAGVGAVSLGSRTVKVGKKIVNSRKEIKAAKAEAKSATVEETKL
jgi:hypothetical protein